MQPVYWPFVAIRLLSIYVLVEGLPHFTPPIWGVLNLFTPSHSLISLRYSLIPALFYGFSAAMLWRFAQPLATRIGREAPVHQDAQAQSSPPIAQLAFAVLSLAILIHEIPFLVQWIFSFFTPPIEVSRVTARIDGDTAPLGPTAIGHILRTGAGLLLFARSPMVADLWLRASKARPKPQ